MSQANRLAVHRGLSEELARLGDRELLDALTPLGSGIGGTSALMEVAGTKVFVKRLLLTDLERAHPRSTANLYGLPAACHYGVGAVGSPGFGAWRELAVHELTTGWVLKGECASFPLLYHWRVLPDEPAVPDELADVERVTEYWGGDPGLRARLQDLRTSSASVALFLEYVPQTLHAWLTADRAVDTAEREVAAGVAFMNARGLLHFDAHYLNILTDGERLYFTDFGLALSSDFDLSPDERAFYDRHRGYDRRYTVNQLVAWLVTDVHGLRVEDREARYELIRAYAAGERPGEVPERVAAVIGGHAPAALAVADFIRAFQRDSGHTLFPPG